MSARNHDTAAYHCPSELHFSRADDRHGVVTFRAASASRPGLYHGVSLDIATDATLCTCPAHERGRRCWHVALVRAAWEGTDARLLAARMSDDQLLRAGTKAARMCAVYRRRSWRVLPADAATLLACRDVWRQRHAAPLAAATSAA